MTDPVLRPAHYNAGKYETIDVIEDSLSPVEFVGYCKGNALKYVLRSDKKHTDKPTEDLRKAIWYLNRAVRSINLQANGAGEYAMQQNTIDASKIVAGTIFSGDPGPERTPHGAKVNRQFPKPLYAPMSGPHFI